MRQGLEACGSHGRWLEDLGSPGAAAGNRQAREQAGRLCAAGADWAMWFGAAELGLRPWWSGDGVRTGKSR